MSKFVYSTSTPQHGGSNPVIKQGKSMPELELPMFTYVCSEGHEGKVPADSELEAECYELGVEEIHISWRQCPHSQCEYERQRELWAYDV